jgi:hypothetical protein
MAPFFVLSSARAGSTSFARILDSASNGCCLTEPVPNLNTETRLAMDGRLGDPGVVVAETIAPRVRPEGIEVYGEKNVTYGPFVGAIHKQLGARFILLTRDGRDVVRSLMDWHEQMFGTVYREAPEAGDLSARARASAGALQVHLDTSDFARPRPLPGDPMYDRWLDASRFEMCSWYWTRIYRLYLDELAAVPESAWFRLDYTNASADDILEAARFLGLEGLERDAVAEMLDARINSLKDRCDEDPSFPAWTAWDGKQRREFAELAEDTMTQVGYWDAPATRWKPVGFGECWQERAADVQWYRWMYEGRERMHDDAIAWVNGLGGDRSVMDFGCGVGEGYCDAFADRVYIGIDLAGPSIEWANANRPNPKHRYETRDFIADPPVKAADIVMSSGTIDNAYDPEAYLDAMICASREFVYLTCYRGWFPDLEEHQFMWSAEHGCFYADLSARRLREHLEARGCHDIVVEARATGRSDIPFETRVIARVPEETR